ncbi:phosphoinositide-3-kinase [Capsaspora owczarzaki ATCC 30864]|uniref:phosphoinositide-3-kinase n=1 Tax=Capsaspora owczarzaki (strain ATCC 30864) TaxID=595528 RepID=UPI000352164B|nr:phosphoinositide-3-kinase [Capsaspora owczarzaki ATCC 30864]|eukprot:XP_004343363.2 phosphoinositide-3-kinase [Capsaspora owczarzaki ATCC 30864]
MSSSSSSSAAGGAAAGAAGLPQASSQAQAQSKAAAIARLSTALQPKVQAAASLGVGAAGGALHASPLQPAQKAAATSHPAASSVSGSSSSSSLAGALKPQPQSQAQAQAQAQAPLLAPQTAAGSAGLSKSPIPSNSNSAPIAPSATSSAIAAAAVTAAASMRSAQTETAAATLSTTTAAKSPVAAPTPQSASARTNAALTGSSGSGSLDPTTASPGLASGKQSAGVSPQSKSPVQASASFVDEIKTRASQAKSPQVTASAVPVDVASPTATPLSPATSLAEELKQRSPRPAGGAPERPPAPTRPATLIQSSSSPSLQSTNAAKAALKATSAAETGTPSKSFNVEQPTKSVQQQPIYATVVPAARVSPAAAMAAQTSNNASVEYAAIKPSTGPSAARSPVGAAGSRISISAPSLIKHTGPVPLEASKQRYIAAGPHNAPPPSVTVASPEPSGSPSHTTMPRTTTAAAAAAAAAAGGTAASSVDKFSALKESRSSMVALASTLPANSSLFLNRWRLEVSLLQERPIKASNQNFEVEAFRKMVCTLRSEFPHTAFNTNKGFICSPIMELEAGGRQTFIHDVFDVNITGPSGATVHVACSVETSTADLIQTACRMLGVALTSPRLKVIGLSEYLETEQHERTGARRAFPVFVAEHEYVHICRKFNREISLVLVDGPDVDRSLMRIEPDDLIESHAEKRLSGQPGQRNSNGALLSNMADGDQKSSDTEGLDALAEFTTRWASSPVFQDAAITLSRYRETQAKIEALCASEQSQLSAITRETTQLIQMAKATCALLGTTETIDIQQCAAEILQRKKMLWSKNGELTDEMLAGMMRQQMNELYRQLLAVIAMYALSMDGEIASEADQDHAIKLGSWIDADTIDAALQALAAASAPAGLNNGSSFTWMSDIPTTQFRVCVQSLHHVPAAWMRFDLFYVDAGLYYGGNLLAPSIRTKPTLLEKGMFDRCTWDGWLQYNFPMRALPMEARLCFTVFGLKIDSKDNNSAQTASLSIAGVPLGWVSLPMFNFRFLLSTGRYLLGMWPDGPADPIGTTQANSAHDECALLQVDLDTHPVPVLHPSALTIIKGRHRFRQQQSSSTSGPVQRSAAASNRSRPTGAGAARPSPESTSQRNQFVPLDDADKKRFWAERNELISHPQALPRVLLSFRALDPLSVTDVHRLLQEWTPLSPVAALELLHAKYPDTRVRETAIEWMSALSDDDLCDCLPQLVQGLKYETFHDSALLRFLIHRALGSCRIGLQLFWCLKADMNINPQFARRCELVLEALLAACGSAMRSELARQLQLCALLSRSAVSVREAKDAQRPQVLQEEMHRTAADMTWIEASTGALNGAAGASGEVSVASAAASSASVRLPLNPSQEVAGINVEQCSYFNSKTLPLRVVFRNADPLGSPINVIYKVGDDLRQDMITLQMIRIMDKLWLREGLDLKMITYRCLATGSDSGMVEMVMNSDTLRRIETEEVGLAGSFKDRPLADWLRKHNQSDEAYDKAVSNFTASCAGYCVATYVLGICDRHNDNIMVTKSGHLFHIDFGKFLGNAQRFGSFKRDRAPFILTPGFAYVINGGEKFNQRFKDFEALCCTAYNVLRRHASLFVNLLGMMMSSGIPELREEKDLAYVVDALFLSASEKEADEQFRKLIDESLSSKFTQINFFIHNVAQVKFTGSSPGKAVSLDTLSFMPNKYSAATEPRVFSVKVASVEKVWNPDKYYVYVMKVSLMNGNEYTLTRRFHQFDEFYQKLTATFPMDVSRMPFFPAKLVVGRSQVRSVSLKRMKELDDFLAGLLNMREEVAHSDLLYTFLHPSVQADAGASRKAPNASPAAALAASNNGSSNGPPRHARTLSTSGSAGSSAQAVNPAALINRTTQAYNARPPPPTVPYLPATTATSPSTVTPQPSGAMSPAQEDSSGGETDEEEIEAS